MRSGPRSGRDAVAGRDAGAGVGATPRDGPEFGGDPDGVGATPSGDPDGVRLPASLGGSEPTIVPYGDAALLVTFGESIDVELNRQAHALAAIVREDRSALAAWGRPVPGYSSLLVPYDPGRVACPAARDRLRALCTGLAALAGTPAAGSDRPLEIPVRYGGADGPDLAEVAALHGLRPEAVVELHCSVPYTVFMLGFSPGFAYLGVLPAALATPRRRTPRTRVPAGSVGIAGTQTGVYPRATPGGWRLIGRTDAVVWDPLRDPPALLAPGDVVRFRPV